MKTIKEIQDKYKDSYLDIPKDDKERLDYLIKQEKLKEKDLDLVYMYKEVMNNAITYDVYKIVIYEEPVGKPRPRFKRIKGKNHIYSANEYYKKQAFIEMNQDQISQFKDKLIYTPCILTCNAYLKIPQSFNKVEKVLAELGTIRPITKPDWDNIGKEYSDLFNNLVWLDDAIVVSAIVNKYYSILPRVEILVSFANSLYNKYQYDSIKSKISNTEEISYYQKGILMKKGGTKS